MHVRDWWLLLTNPFTHEVAVDLLIRTRQQRRKYQALSSTQLGTADISSGYVSIKMTSVHLLDTRKVNFATVGCLGQ